MKRLVFASLLALSLALAPSPSVGQAPLGEGPPMPAAMDLRKVAVGSWADYRVGVGTMPAMKTRMALVARAKNAVTLEMVVDGGMIAAAGGKMVLQTVVDADPSRTDAVKRLVMQMGAGDPMEMPPESAQRKQFQKPDPRSFVRDETISVVGGTFKAKHYRQKTAKGEPLEFWISEQVPPFGLVKILGQQALGGPGGTATPTAVSFELEARGTNAASVIVRPIKPFDQRVFMGQVMNGARASGEAAAQPPAK